MIRLIEALNFRCLHDIQQSLGPFHVLVGPNATGKTTFLDVISFLGQLVSQGPEAAVRQRTGNFDDLVWGRSGNRIELAIEAKIPEERHKLLSNSFDTIRYEVAVGPDSETDQISILEEKASLKNWQTPCERQRTLFPMEVEARSSILTPKRAKGSQSVLTKAPGGNDNFYSEVQESTGKGWFPSIKLGSQRSTLGNLPADEKKFPVSSWLKNLLAEGVKVLVLNSLLIRKASTPGQEPGLKSDGSNLPWVVEDLRDRSNDRYRDWISHLQTALPDLQGVETVLREDDKHRYLVLCYRDGLRVPSWMASDGTLRLLALTLPAYLPDFKGVYLIEEPENGIHPRAIDTLFQSLSSVYDAQILLATHSPVILSVAELQHLLCFKKTETGATDIVIGSEHPALRKWQGETNLGSLFAAGVLG